MTRSPSRERTHEPVPVHMESTIFHPRLSTRNGLPLNVPVIMLHGIYGSRYNWDIFPQLIADHAQSIVHVVDMRNHGQSEKSSEMHYSDLAMDVDRYMQEHGLAKAVLVGHSMGAKAAMTMALHPNPQVQKRVHGLVILDTPPRPIFVPDNFHNCDLATRLIEQNDIRCMKEMNKALELIFPVSSRPG